jgi:hypothetical protein
LNLFRGLLLLLMCFDNILLQSCTKFLQAPSSIGITVTTSSGSSSSGSSISNNSSCRKEESRSCVGNGCDAP